MSQTKDNIKGRQCPCCHRKVSLWTCSNYFIKGTDKSIRCNHCHEEIIPVEDPLNFNACLYAGFFSAFIIVLLAVVLLDFDFPKAMMLGIAGVMVEEIVIMILILKRIRFRCY